MLKIVQVNQMESSGGAAKIAQSLHQKLLQMGHRSWMLVGKKETSDESVMEFSGSAHPDVPNPVSKAMDKINIPFGKKSLGHYLRRLQDPRRILFEELGLEDYHFPSSRKLTEFTQQVPDIVHLHNLHEKYFDLNYIPELSDKMPVIITLHDAWLLSGHCAHSLECERWKTGCGLCPHLESYPAVKRDATLINWMRKRKIFLNSRLYIATPSHWLMDKVESSILKPAMVEGRVIHNGIDTSVFNPDNRVEARRQLGISDNTIALLFVANLGAKNNYKDFITVSTAVEIIKDRLSNHNILFLVVGGTEEEVIVEEDTEQIHTLYIPYQLNPKDVANCYCAADIYLQASRADTFPGVILEALACGTPVVATAVGGIPEQIIDGVTGFLVNPGDAVSMADAAVRLISDGTLRSRMSRAAVENARERFGLDKMVNSYLGWYYEILEKHYAKNNSGKI